MPMKLCGEPATHRVTWPGKEAIPQCDEHAWQIKALANSMGWACDFLEPEPGDACIQKIEKKDK